MNDVERARHLDALGRAQDRAEREQASRASHGDDLILVGATCQVCGSPGGWGLYWTAATGVIHCRECMEVRGMIRLRQPRCSRKATPRAGSSPAVAA